MKRYRNANGYCAVISHGLTNQYGASPLLVKADSGTCLNRGKFTIF